MGTAVTYHVWDDAGVTFMQNSLRMRWFPPPALCVLYVHIHVYMYVEARAWHQMSSLITLCLTSQDSLSLNL